ncbi:hypothetical protein [uncultured Helicobacter sp.]|uniref:hypothetical protein n=1 Tax=uncultured Helicobacter sp. TaxID=175537 RepID=UPI00374EC65D
MIDFNAFAHDIAKILPQRFVAFDRERKCLSNSSTKIVYDIACATEITLLVLEQDNADLSVNTTLDFEGKTYLITQIERESRLMLRLFLKEERTYAYTQ